MSERRAPEPVLNPLRGIFVVNSVQRRWPFALRAAVCMAVPVLVGWWAGDTTAGLLATIGGFTSLYGSGRPYLNRGLYLGAIVLSFAAAVTLGDWAAGTPWLAVPAVTAISVLAVLLCHVFAIGPPGAYMFVLACAAGTGLTTTSMGTGRLGLLVLAGGAFAWCVHMLGALVRPRGPERAAVRAAARSVEGYIDALGDGAGAEAAARHQAAHLLHTAWMTLVNYQPVQAKPDRTLHRLRVVNRQLHALFGEAMAAADAGRPLPFDGAAKARKLATLAVDLSIDETGAEGIPLGRPSARQLLGRALRAGSPSLRLALRTGIAVLIAGAIASALTMNHAYWAMAASVLMLHQGSSWVRTLQRGIERGIGTWLGLGVAGLILALHPQGLWLVLVIAALQFTIEMYVVRNYTLAVVFITPAALTIASGGLPVANLGQLLLARGADTLIGCAVALLVYWVTQRRRPQAGLADAISAALDAIAATLPHLSAGAVTTAEARTARRDLQLRVMALLPSYDTGIGGSAAQRVAAERMWPTVAAIEQLGYRTLAACWALERDGDTTAAADTAAALADQLSELNPPT